MICVYMGENVKFLLDQNICQNSFSWRIIPRVKAERINRYSFGGIRINHKSFEMNSDSSENPVGTLE